MSLQVMTSAQRPISMKPLCNTNVLNFTLNACATGGVDEQILYISQTIKNELHVKPISFSNPECFSKARKIAEEKRLIGIEKKDDGTFCVHLHTDKASHSKGRPYNLSVVLKNSPVLLGKVSELKQYSEGEYASYTKIYAEFLKIAIQEIKNKRNK